MSEEVFAGGNEQMLSVAAGDAPAGRAHPQVRAQLRERPEPRL